MVYYAVVAKTSSWSFEQPIGEYQTIELARNVARIVSKSPMKDNPEGLVVIVRSLSENVIVQGQNLYVLNKSDGAFKPIKKCLTGQDLLNFANLTFAKPC